MLKRVLFILCALLVLVVSTARADVGVVLNESMDTGGDRFSSTGHSAVYFSRICPQTPVKLRVCHPGEQGSILSNYTGFGETRPFEWNVAPLGVFLYGVENPRRWPLVGTEKIKRALEERYREDYLSAYCSAAPCTTSDKADWREMAGAGLSRNIYIFAVETTLEQDRELIEQFNSLPNENHFNAATKNCADFTRSVIDTYFPHATKPEYLNDFGMSTPKAMARSFTRYALLHPELRFHVLHFAQLPGTIKRSKETRDPMEQLYRSKLLIVPIVMFAEYVLPVAAATYGITGRFNPEHELEKRPTVREAEIANEIQEAKAEKDKKKVARLQAAEREERARVLGTDEEWKSYRKELHAMVEGAVEGGIIPNRKSVGDIFERLEKSGAPLLDAKGELWLEVSEGGQSSGLGLSAGNILSTGSDPKLAYRLLLARTDRVLKSPKHSRETMLMFKRDWALLEAARRRSGMIEANSKPAASRHGARRPGEAAGIPRAGIV